MREKSDPDRTHFVTIREVEEAPSVLWDLLLEREPHQGISHREMPTAEQHLAFVSKHPYRVWYLIRDKGEWIGSAYLTRHCEIGVFIFKAHRGKGFGTWAVRDMSRRFPGRIYANIAPTNPESKAFFESLGFRHIQNTLLLGEPITGEEQLARKS